MLPREQWVPLAQAHHDRVDARTREHLARRARGEKHAVEDFVWTYYRHRPAQLRRWHPGPGVVLENAPDHEATRHYTTSERDGTRLTSLNVSEFMSRRGSLVRHIHDLLTATAGRTPTLGCFGLHEWAMVYRGADHRRHPAPLRLGASGTDEVVDSMQISCTHFDAYRFFTPDARPLNTLEPTREGQLAMEQPGCLHAGMDLYKWCFKLAPAVPSELTLEAFRLARDIRELDMRAAPYDLRELGYEPIRIETPSGRAEYAAAQRGFTVRSNALRRRLLEVLDRIAVEQPQTSR